MDNPASSDTSLASLEFPAVLDRLSSKTRTPYGAERARLLRPSPVFEQAREFQVATREMARYCQVQGALPLALTVDVRQLLAGLEIEGSILAGQEINLLLEQLKASQEIRTLLSRCDQPGLRSLGRALPDLVNLLRYLEGKISAAGQLEDRCSTDLLRIRRQVAALSSRLEEALRAISSRPEVARALQDTFVALRNNRHVLPVRIDGQACVEGIVHALSSSGATVYVEPLSTVPLNNELVRLKEQEEVEIRRVLLDFSDLFRGRLAELHQMLRTLAEADLLGAKAALAAEMRAIEPELVEAPPGGEGAGLRLRGARHPVLERSLEGSGRSPIPLDLEMGHHHGVLVISGPNTGGKTVALKTVGLLAAMAQCGLRVPADEVRLPVFRRILIDIGDHQSIPDSLSTFSARLANVSAMARDLEAPALVLLDEVGTGTDPEEGACLGAAIIDYFRDRGATVLATTHHQAIKAYAATTSGVENASMEFDEHSLIPLFRLRHGVPGRSSGLDIARRLGLPEEIVRSARDLLPRQREILESYLRALQGLQEEMQKRIHDLDERTRRAELQEREREEAARRLALDREARFSQCLEELAARLEGRWESYLRKVADQDERRRIRRDLEREAGKLLEKAHTAMDADLLPAGSPGRRGVPFQVSPGDRVRATSLNVEGSVERVEGNRVVLRSGSKRLTLPLSDLEAAGPAAKPGAAPPAKVRLAYLPGKVPPMEINLIGKRVEEALDLLDKYLDDAYLASATPVRIIHGVGTGRLREAIRRFLESHPHVEGYTEAAEREGGHGATVVRVRI